MADTGLNAIEKAIMDALNVAGVTAEVSQASHWNMVVPPGESFPAIVISLHDDDREGAGFSSDAGTVQYLVKGIAGGVNEYDPSVAGDIQTAIDTVLHGATLTATGFTVYACKRVRRIRFAEVTDERNVFYHAGAIYRIWHQP